MQNTNRLRLVLRANATTSFVGGLIATVAAGWVSDTLGVDHVALTRLVGIGLMVFAADVAWLSTRPADTLRTGALLVSIADAIWMLTTVAVLAAGVLTTTGTVVAIVVGVAVADFGITQLWLRSKLAPTPSAVALAA